jgi:hypothetical protein
LVCAGPEAAENRWLREALENRLPIIYFPGIAPGGYQAIESMRRVWGARSGTLAPRVSPAASARRSGKKVIERIK